MRAQMWTTGIVLPFFKLGTRRGGWLSPRPRRFTPGITRYTLYRKLDGPQGLSGRVGKIHSYRDKIPGKSSSKMCVFFSISPTHGFLDKVFSQVVLNIV